MLFQIEEEEEPTLDRKDGRQYRLRLFERHGSASKKGLKKCSIAVIVDRFVHASKETIGLKPNDVSNDRERWYANSIKIVK